MDRSLPDPPTAVFLHGILGCRKNWGGWFCVHFFFLEALGCINLMHGLNCFYVLCMVISWQQCVAL